jgi:predicted anti-sigma-YlaC factor YlaD
MGAFRSAECERARLCVSLRLDGELSELESASLRGHLGSCVACAGFQQETAELTRDLRAAPLQAFEATVAVGVQDNVVVALPRRRTPAMRVLQVSAAAAAVVLAAGLGSLAGSLSSRVGSTTTATSARTGGLDPGIVAMLPEAGRPTLRSGPSVPV